MAGNCFDPVPSDLAQLPIVWKHLCGREHFGGDVDHGPDARLADSDSVLFHGIARRNRAGARFHATDGCLYSLDRTTRTGARGTSLTISAMLVENPPARQNKPTNYDTTIISGTDRKPLKHSRRSRGSGLRHRRRPDWIRRLVGSRTQSWSSHTYFGAGDPGDRFHRGDCVLRALPRALSFRASTSLHWRLIMNLTFFAAASFTETLKETADTFGWNWELFLSQVISFTIVAFLLRRFAYKPILAVLEDRRQKIEEGMLNAEKIRKELAEAEKRYQEILAKANADAQRMIDEARESSSHLAERKQQEAIAAAEQIVAKAKEAAALEHERQMQTLKREIGRLVVDTTAKVTGKVLTPEDQKRLQEEAARQVA